MTKEGSGDWWTKSWNPVTGCSPCSPGCQHCWAAGMVRRFPHLHGDDRLGEFPGGLFGQPHLHRDRMDQPLAWKTPQRVFVCSLGDLFYDEVPDPWVADVFDKMARCPQHTFVVLTKRIGLASSWFSCRLKTRFGGAEGMPHSTLLPLRNVWLGVTVCDQREADVKVPELLRTPAAVRFVSVEPMLGPVDLHRWLLSDYDKAAHDSQLLVPPGGFTHRKLDWVICGGETGPGARRMRMEWAFGLRDQCHEAGVPFWFKGCGTNAESGLPKNHPAYRWLDGEPGPLELPEVKPWTR